MHSDSNTSMSQDMKNKVSSNFWNSFLKFPKNCDRERKKIDTKKISLSPAERNKKYLKKNNGLTRENDGVRESWNYFFFRK